MRKKGIMILAFLLIILGSAGLAGPTNKFVTAEQVTSLVSSQVDITLSTYVFTNNVGSLRATWNTDWYGTMYLKNGSGPGAGPSWNVGWGPNGDVDGAIPIEGVSTPYTDSLYYQSTKAANCGFVLQAISEATGGLVTASVLTNVWGSNYVTRAQATQDMQAAGAYLTNEASWLSASGTVAYVTNLGSAAYVPTGQFAMASQGVLADGALSRTGGTMSGDIILNAHYLKSMNPGGNTNNPPASIRMITGGFGSHILLNANGFLISTNNGGTYTPIATLDDLPDVPVYHADGMTIQKNGTTFSLASGIVDELFNNWYSASISQTATGAFFTSGPSYIFNDQNGVLLDRSSGYVWATNGYQNELSIAITTNAFYQGSSFEQYQGSVGSGNNATFQAVSSGFTLAYNIYFAGVPSDYGSAGGYEMPTYLGATDSPNFEYLLAFNCESESGVTLYNIYVGSSTLSYLSSPVLSYCTWIRVVLTQDGDGNLTTYINGSEIESHTGVLQLGSSGEDGTFMLGGQNQFGGAGPYWRLWGSMNDVCFWRNYTMSSDDVAAMPSSMLGTTYTNSASAYYPMNENSGDVLHDVIGGNNLTNFGGVAWQTMENLTPGDSPFSPMSLVCTNFIVRDYTAGQAKATFAINIGTNTVSTNDISAGVIDIDAGTTNWATSLRVYTQRPNLDQYWAGDVTGLSGTNFAGIVSVSSNQQVLVKAMGFPLAPIGQ